MPRVFGFFVFASAGLPGLSGFVGEFLVLRRHVRGRTRTPPPSPTFVMILAAGYLLYMYGRVVFGELSDFLAGLGDHLTDMTPVEILTLAPLGALVVIFGIQPGLLLDLVDEHGRPRRSRRSSRRRRSRSRRRSWSGCSRSWPGAASSPGSRWVAASGRGARPLEPEAGAAH